MTFYAKPPIATDVKKKKKKISHRPRSVAWELIPFEAL